MDSTPLTSEQKPATAARMYDFYLGGVHNFPADREAATRAIEQYPDAPLMAQINRAFLGHAVRRLSSLGIRQFLDVGSGIPTKGNVHEIAQDLAPESRIVYVDIDSVAVAESLEILDDNPLATAVRADLLQPQTILDHPAVRQLLDFDEPIGLLLAAVLHFVPDNAEAMAVVSHLMAALPAGSYLVVSHGAMETFAPRPESTKTLTDVYARQTTTSVKMRTQAEVQEFFNDTNLLDPGVIWAYECLPDTREWPEVAGEPHRSGAWAGIGRKA